MDYYIKCETCKHANLLKTKYLMFCEKCGQKLRDNFSDWQKANVDKDFGAFQREVAISQAQVEEEQQNHHLQKQYVTKRKKLFGMMVIVFLVLLLCLVYFIRRYV